MKTTSIATKIGLALSILITGYFSSMVYGYVVGCKTESRAYYVSDSLYPASFHSQEAMVAFDKQIKFYKDAVISEEIVDIESADEQAGFVQKALQDIVAIEDLEIVKKEKIVVAKNALSDFTKKARSIYAMSASKEENVEPVSVETQKNIVNQLQDLSKKTRQYRKELKDITSEFSADLKNELDSISKQTKHQRNLNVIIFLLVVSVSLIIIYFIIKRTVAIPLKNTVNIISEIASGDLTREIYVIRKDEVGQIIDALRRMVNNLKEIVNMVAITTEKTSAAAFDISAAVEEQAAVTSQQSSSVSEITATMEELSITTTQVAEYADSVAGLAAESLNNTKTGANSVELVTNKMQEINADNQNNIKDIIELGKKSEEINKVMVIINNIADQTKLIAFNAALEASSAGEAGKRFGVVAAEIRRLADSVLASTGETESKIREIQEAVNNMVIASEKSSKGIQDGLIYSTETAQKLAKIVTGAQETADAAKQISLSTQQELSATEQVLTALKEIELGAKQAATSIGQIGFISKDLETLSKDLTGLIGKFKLVKDKV